MLALARLSGSRAAQDALRPYTVVGDAIPASLTGAPGDAERGRAIVTNRQVGLCLLCHSGPFPQERFQGNMAPDLKGAGARWTRGTVAAADRRWQPAQSGHDHAALLPRRWSDPGRRRRFRGKPILTAEQIEDVVAFLMTLEGLRQMDDDERSRRRRHAARRIGARRSAPPCRASGARAARPGQMEAAIRSVAGEAKIKQGKVTLDMPPLVENGNTVPMSVTVDSPMTQDESRQGDPRLQREEPAAERDHACSSVRAPARRTSRPASASPTRRR